MASSDIANICEPYIRLSSLYCPTRLNATFKESFIIIIVINKEFYK